LLLSKVSVESRWINFEAGYAHALDKRLYPLVVGGIGRNIGAPLAEFLMVRELADSAGLEVVLRSLAEQLAARVRTPIFDGRLKVLRSGL
jgi:hypothetical protein